MEHRLKQKYAIKGGGIECMQHASSEILHYTALPLEAEVWRDGNSDVRL